MSEASRHSSYHQGVTIVTILFISALSLMLAAVYRSCLSARSSSPSS